MKLENLEYDGKYNKIFVADFYRYYFGNIKSIDSDEYMAKNGKFYSLEYLTNPYHIKAIEKCLKKKN